MSQADTSSTNARLGYPAEARLLLINADDLGMYEDINQAVVRAATGGIVRSTSLMAPCPAAPEAIRLLQQHPDLSFAVHLSIIRDIPTYQWGPMAPREQVPSLLDRDGTLYVTDRMAELLAAARLDEVEIEFRAQIGAVLAAGLQPTHLDWHCLHNGGRADIFGLTLGLAREHGLALRVGGQPYIDQVQGLGLPTDDHDLLDSFALPTAGKTDRYVELLRALPVGLTEWAVHPGGDSAAARAIDPEGWPVRQADFDFLASEQARRVIAEEGIILISYEPLRRAWLDRA